MSVFQPGNVAYGLSQPLIGVPNEPIVSQRAPTTADRAAIGTLWIDQPTNTPYILTSIVDNIATWVFASGGSSVLSIVTNSGTAMPVAGVINLIGINNIITTAAGNIVDVAVTPNINLPPTNAAGTQGIYEIGGSHFAFAYPPSNTFVGISAGNTTLNAAAALDNTGIGNLSLSSLTLGTFNTAVGQESLGAVTTGDSNTAIGERAAPSITTGSSNTVVGELALDNLITGNNNIVLGVLSAAAYTTSESSNIIINNSGVIGESNVIRVGTQGSGAGQQDACAIAGIYNTAIGATHQVMFIDNTGFLGSSKGTDGQVIIGSTAGSPAWANLTAGANVTITNAANSITIAASGGGGGITTLDGDAGSATGATVTIAGGNNITTSAAGATLTLDVSGTTQHSLLLGNATGSINSLGVATDGEIPIGSTGADPVLATITAGSGITVTNGAGSITIAASGGGSGIVTIDGDTGSATGATVTFTGNGVSNAGSSVIFAAAGSTVDLQTSDASDNTLVGFNSGNGTLSGATNSGLGYATLHSLTTGTDNSAMGAAALHSVNTGDENTAAGENSLGLLTSGSFNTSMGAGSLSALLTGSLNIAIGWESGLNYTTSESSNILIGNPGVVSEGNAIHIGTQGSGAGQQDTCFIAGITGVTVASSAAVLINTGTGQLGTISSSRRYKENINDMDNASNNIMNLRPTTFFMKNDPTKQRQYGLIAEEVNEILPDLVTYNKAGDPESVKYHDLPVLLLNELQKQNNIIAELQRKIAVLENRRRYESEA